MTTRDIGPIWRKSNSTAFGRAGRILLFAGGLGLVGWLIHSVTTARVIEVMRQAEGWLPVVALLETPSVATDLVAARVLLGPGGREVRRSTWIRSTAVAYASSIFLPLGKAAGELARAATLTPTIGAARASQIGAHLQACALVANSIASVVCLFAALAARTVGTSLVIALAGNALVCGTLAAILFVAVRSGRLSRWLRGRFPRLATTPASSPSPTFALPVAISLCVVGRVAQTVQYGALLRAVGCTATPALALTAQGIHLVGAALGDVVPNQMGATEGAYYTFARTLGLGSEPARALSIALIGRIVQIGLAAVGLLVAAFTVRQLRETDHT